MQAGERQILNGLSLDGARRRGARDHGPERFRQEHARRRPRRPPGLRGRLRQRRPTWAATCSQWRPRSAPARASSSRFQYPVEIPGVNNVYLLKAALNALRKHRGEPELDAFEFLNLVREQDRG